MRRILAAVAATAAVAACGGHDMTPPPTGPITADVLHYDYTFDITSRAATASVTATVTTAGDCFTLPFRADGLANAMFDAEPAVSATSDATSAMICGTGVAAGEQLTVSADTTVALATLDASQVGYSVTNDSDGNPFYYLVSWVEGCDQFGPCDNRANQFATYSFHVTHPAELTVRCPGTVTDVDPMTTTCDFEFPGGPTYSTFGIAAYPAWTQTSLGTWSDLNVTLYDRADTNIAAAIDPAYHSGFVAWMESQFGPFPYGSDLRILTAPTYWNGFEHPTNIVLADTLAKQKNSGYANNTAHVIDHETTHMWAGNQTTLADPYDFAWKEAMAEYLPYVWEDMNDSAVGRITAGAWKTFGRTAEYPIVPDDHPTLIAYYGDVYGPGPMILFRQLEVLSSRAQVIAAIQSVIGKPGTLSVDDLVTALQTQTGLDLTAYAAAWIHGTGTVHYPSYTLTYTAGTGETSTLQLALDNPDTAGGKLCKFHVELDGADPTTQNALVEVDTFHNGANQTLTVPTPAFPVTAIILDPQNECLVYASATTPLPPTPHVNPWVSVEPPGDPATHEVLR